MCCAAHNERISKFLLNQGYCEILGIYDQVAASTKSYSVNNDNPLPLDYLLKLPFWMKPIAQKP